MTIRTIAICIIPLLLASCIYSKKQKEEFVLTESSGMEQILTRGSLKVFTLYNTTDFYVYQGTTRGFHYELVRDFAQYLGVKLQIVEVNSNLDTAMAHLRAGKYDLMAMGLSQTPERQKQVCFSQPLVYTNEVLVQNRSHPLITHPEELNGQDIYIPASFSAYNEVLQTLQDSLGIRIQVTELETNFNEDLIHLVETGKIRFTVIDENIAQASSFTMKNIDYSLKLRENIAISWATRIQDKQLMQEINDWLTSIKKNGKLKDYYRRYFENTRYVPANMSKYSLLKQGKISPYDLLLQKIGKQTGWDWRLLAAIVYRESHFNPDAQSNFGAYGLMQVMPETASHFNVTDYFQPDSNLYVGVAYLNYLDQLLSRHVTDAEERTKFVLASYNAGPGHVLDAIRLAQKYGKNPQLWDKHVDYFLLHKNEPIYYQDSVAKNGYCNGLQACRYVQNVLDTYNEYIKITE